MDFSEIIGLKKKMDEAYDNAPWYCITRRMKANYAVSVLIKIRDKKREVDGDISK